MEYPWIVRRLSTEIHGLHGGVAMAAAGDGGGGTAAVAAVARRSKCCRFA
jgi:hypothetical protein